MFRLLNKLSVNFCFELLPASLGYIFHFNDFKPGCLIENLKKKIRQLQSEGFRDPQGPHNTLKSFFNNLYLIMFLTMVCSVLTEMEVPMTDFRF